MATLTTTITIVEPSALVQSAYRGPCRILGAHVTRVTDGGTTRVCCGEYGETEGVCLLRKAALEYGRPQGLLEASPESLAVGAIRCVMLTA